MRATLQSVGAALLAGLLIATPALPVIRQLASGCALPLAFGGQTCRFPLYGDVVADKPEPAADLRLAAVGKKLIPDPD